MAQISPAQSSFPQPSSPQSSLPQSSADCSAALVFSGGGARGAFEYGVWKALKEIGVLSNIKGIAGTSIGALNTMFYIQKAYYKAGDLWSSLSLSHIIHINRSFLSLLLQIIKSWPDARFHLSDIFRLVPYLKSFTGFLDHDSLYTILNDNINMARIEASTLDTFICCTRLPSARGEAMAPVYFDIKAHHYTKAELIDIAMASGAIYPFFDKIEIKESYYIDGGFTDNTPIFPLYETGYRKFIVVYLSHPKPASDSDETIRFPDGEFVDIRPSSDLPTGAETTLNFSQEFITAFMNDGYAQTMKLSKDIIKLLT